MKSMYFFCSSWYRPEKNSWTCGILRTSINVTAPHFYECNIISSGADDTYIGIHGYWSSNSGWGHVERLKTLKVSSKYDITKPLRFTLRREL